MSPPAHVESPAEADHLATEPGPGTPDITAVAVIGGGTMGSGIAQTIAQADVPVRLIERAEVELQRAMRLISERLDRAVDTARLSRTEADGVRAKITTATDYAAVAGVDLVVEAVFEDRSLKMDIFRAIAPLLGPRAILATNTSSISVTALGAATPHPERVVGMHFFNPVPVVPLVEIVLGLETSDETVARVSAFATRIGKTPVVVNDAPGFVANRVLMPMLNEAIFCLAEGVATRDAIDQIMKLGMAHPMGPLALADLIGLDVCLAILDVLHHDIGDDKFRPSPLLRKMVAAGKLGRKTGEGFYVYQSERRHVKRPNALTQEPDNEPGPSLRQQTADPHPGREAGT